MTDKGHISWIGSEGCPPYPHVVPMPNGYAVRDALDRTVTVCDNLETALAWTRLMPLTPEDVSS